MKKISTLLFILVMAAALFAQTDITIGTGTSYTYEPISSYYGYQRSAAIYTSAEIGGSGTINSIAYKAYNSVTKTIPIVVYMKMTTATTLAPAQSWPTLISGLTPVYSGNVTSSTAGTWTTITLTTPFDYTGNNLEVLVESNYGGSGSSPYMQWYYSTAANLNQYIRKDYSAPTTETGTVNSSRPNIQLNISNYTAFPPIFGVSPTSVNFGQVRVNTTTSYVNVTVTNMGTGTLNITSVALGGNDQARFILDMNSNPTPWSLGAGVSKIVKVAFNPTEERDYSAYLRFTGDVKTDHDVPLTGSGFDPTIKTFPYTESFDGTTFAPVGWTNTATVGTVVWDRQTSGTYPTCSPYSGAAMARYNSYNSSSGNKAILVTPPINFPGNDYRVKFWFYRDAAYLTNADLINVYYNTAANTTGATLLGTINRSIQLSPTVATAGWYEYVFNMPTGAEGNGRYIIFEAVSAYGDNMFLDHVTLEQLPAQPVFTISPSSTTKDFGSVMINTPATQKYTISNTGAGTLAISSVEVTGTYYSKSIDITDNALTAGESTDFTVQFLPTVAGGPYTGSVAITYGSSKDVYNISLTGTCYDPTITTFPYTENFDGVTAPALPSGWTYINANNDANYWKTSTSYPRSTPNSLYISYNSSMAMDDWVFSPPLSLNSGSTYIVEFYYRSSGSFPEKLKLMAGHSPSAAGMTETIIDLGSFMSATYLKSTNNFTPTSKGIYYLGWYGYSDMDEYYICIDDVSVTEAPTAPGFSIAPTSKDFGSVQIDQSSTPQIFTITNTGGGTLFIDKDDITIGGTNATDFILTPIENDISLSGGATANITVTFKPTAFGTRTGSLDIIDNTAEKAVHHVSLTGSGYYPPVANKVNDFESGWGTTTAVNGSEVNQWCVGSATFSRSQSAYISNDGGTTNAYTITSSSVVHFYNDISLPPLTGGLYKIELSFDWKAEGEGSSPYYYDYLRVFLIDTATTPSAGTELTSGQIGSTYNLHGTEWQNAKIDLSSFAGTTKRLVFSWRNDGTVGYQPPAAVDNIKIDYYYDFVPVELTSFTAVLSSEMFVNLSWVVASETNHLGYNVLRNTGNELNTAVRINKDIITEGQSTGTEVSYSYIDKEIEFGQTYYYWLQNIDIDGSYNYYGPVTATVNGGPGGPETPVIPLVNRLADAYPNPFKSATTLSYEIKEAGPVRIDIYNVRGQIVRSFTANHNKAGDYKIVWDGKDEAGTQVSSGVYFYNMQFGKYHSVKKVLLTK